MHVVSYLKEHTTRREGQIFSPRSIDFGIKRLKQFGFEEEKGGWRLFRFPCKGALIISGKLRRIEDI